MKTKVVGIAELVKSVGGAIAVTLSLLGGGIGIVVWVYQLRNDTTETRKLLDEHLAEKKEESDLADKVDELTRAIKEGRKGGN